MVSEIVLIRRLVERKDALALFILPYVSVVTEKDRYLRNLLKKANIKVHGFYGGSQLPVGVFSESSGVAVCTIEKANSIVSHLLETNQMSRLVCCVVDEVHLLSDPHRGFQLEITLAKLRRFAPECQIVAMSATLPNLQVFEDWLEALTFQTNFRPVPLKQMLCIGKEVTDILTGELIRTVEPPGVLDSADGVFFTLTLEVISAGHSVLIFCPSKLKCEHTADAIAKAAELTYGAASHDSSNQRLIAELRLSPGGLDPMLAKTVPFGVGFHHSGLTVEERSLIETAYREGILRCLTATSTLAAGVNLPARRVLFRSPFIAAEFIDASRYLQMAGRAGRAGQGELGESIVVCEAKHREQMLKVARQAAIPPLVSGLGIPGLSKLLLECICAKGAMTELEIRALADATLLMRSRQDDSPLAENNPVDLSMRSLVSWSMVALDGGLFFATPLGRAVSGSGIDIAVGKQVFAELSAVRSKGLNVESDLHLCYLILGMNVGYDGGVNNLSVNSSSGPSLHINWSAYLSAIESLPSAERRVFGIIGVKPGLIQKASLHNSIPAGSRNTSDAAIITRFYSALLLWLMSENPISAIASRFGLPRGSLQALRSSAGASAHSLATFCQKMRWFSLEAIIDVFSKRATLGLGQAAELAPLMQINGMTRAFAAELFSKGHVSPALVSKLSPWVFASAIRPALPASVSALPFGMAEKLIKAAKEHVKQLERETRAVDKAKRARVQESGMSVPWGASSALGLASSAVRNIPSTILDSSSPGMSSALKASQDWSTPLRKRRRPSDALPPSLTESQQAALVEAIGCLEADENLHIQASGASARRQSISSVGGTPSRRRRRLSLSSQESRVSVGSLSTAYMAEGIEPLYRLRAEYYRSLVVPGFSGWKFEVLKGVPSSVQAVGVTGNGGDLAKPFLLVFAPFCGVAISIPEFLEILSRPEMVVVAGDCKAMLIYLYRAMKATVNNSSQTAPISPIRMPAIACTLIDTLVAKHILDPDCTSEPGRNPPSFLNSETTSRLRSVPAAFQPAARAYAEASSLLRSLSSQGMLGPYFELEMPMTRILADMEISGIAVKSLDTKFIKDKMVAIESAVDEMVGRPVVLTSPEDVSRALFDELLIPRDEGTTVEQSTLLNSQLTVNRDDSQASTLGLYSGGYSGSALAGNLDHGGSPLPAIPKRAKHKTTKKGTLARIEHPVASLVSEHRKLVKVYSNCLAVDGAIKEGRVHGIFGQVATATGRLVVSHPPLLMMEDNFFVSGLKRISVEDEIERRALFVGDQDNIAVMLRKKEDVELTEGKSPGVFKDGDLFRIVQSDADGSYTALIRDFSTGTEISLPASAVFRADQPPTIDDSITWKISVREMFTAPADKLLMSVDYAQIELRILAHYCQDRNLLEILNRKDQDVFKSIASLWLQRTVSEISNADRNRCKKICYGLLYGMGIKRLSEQLGVSEDAGENMMAQFHSAFPGIRPWMASAITRARSSGFVESIGGRKRFIPAFSGTPKEQARGERQAINTICQASAADLLKAAMIRITERLRSEGLERDARIVLQIHDELLIECSTEQIERLKEIVTLEITRNVLRVSLCVTWAIGPSWGELTEATFGVR